MTAISPSPSLLRHLSAVWQFARPHTIYGTVVSVIGIFLLTLGSWQQISALWQGLTLALPTCLAANVYIMGLNQLCDVEINHIKRPLPISAGTLSRKQGQFIVLVLGIASLLLATASPYLFATVAFSCVIGTAYSVPPIRLKRFPFLASLCIYLVRGVVVNVGLYFFFLVWAGGDPSISVELILLLVFVVLFTYAIAVFKDIPDMDRPDMEGGEQSSVETRSSHWRAVRTFNLCLAILTLAYGIVGSAAFVLLPLKAAIILALGHALALLVLDWYRRQLPSWGWQDMYQYYQLIWKLFYFEYVLFPMAYLLGTA